MIPLEKLFEYWSSVVRSGWAVIFTEIDASAIAIMTIGALENNTRELTVNLARYFRVGIHWTKESFELSSNFPFFYLTSCLSRLWYLRVRPGASRRSCAKHASRRFLIYGTRTSVEITRLNGVHGRHKTILLFGLRAHLPGVDRYKSDNCTWSTFLNA